MFLVARSTINSVTVSEKNNCCCEAFTKKKKRKKTPWPKINGLCYHQNICITPCVFIIVTLMNTLNNKNTTTTKMKLVFVVGFFFFPYHFIYFTFVNYQCHNAFECMNKSHCFDFKEDSDQSIEHFSSS